MKPDAMTVRDRFHAVMQFKPFDRLPMIEWACWWDKTIERWQSEGLTTTDRYDLYREFGLDLYYQDWIPSSTAATPHPASHGAGLVANMDEYEKVRPTLFPDVRQDAARLANWRRMAAEQARGECVVWITLEGFFWFPRTLLGIGPHMFAFYDQPELMHRMNQDLTDWMLQTVGTMCEIITPDFMTFAEDMSYNHGPMLSEGLFDEFMLPYYRQVAPRLQERGIMPIVDSDGRVDAALPWFERAGVQGALPLERQAGVDVGEWRKRFPKMRFIGGYDKMVMPLGEAAMRTEFERLLPAARQGGFIFSVDHQTPPGVSLANYRIYLKLLAEYARKAAD